MELVGSGLLSDRHDNSGPALVVALHRLVASDA